MFVATVQKNLSNCSTIRPVARSSCRTQVRRNLIVNVGSAGIDPSTSLNVSELTKCPVLRSLQDAPKYKFNQLFDTLDLCYGDPFTFQAKVTQSGKEPVVTTAGGTALTYLGNATLTREVLSNDKDFSLQSAGAEKVLGPRAVIWQTGAKHEQLRALMSPAFAPAEIEKYTPKVQGLVSKYMEELAQQSKNGRKAVRAHDQMRRLTFEVICSVVLGVQFSKHELAKMFDDFILLDGGILAAAMDTAGKASFLWHPWMIGGKAMAGRARVVARLQREVDAAMADVQAGKSLAGQGLLKELIELAMKSNQVLTKDEVLDNMVFFMQAGFDTTSSLLASMIENIDKHPQHWAPVVEEQQRMAEQHGEQLTPKLLRQMTAADNFVRETLRLRLPTGTLTRTALRDVEVGGYKIPEGTMTVQPLQFLATSDPLWEGETGDLALTKFNPSRFEKVKGSGQQMPFGFGKHSCLGQPVATMEAKVVLAVLARGFQVKVAKKSKWMNFASAHPMDGLPVYVSRK